MSCRPVFVIALTVNAADIRKPQRRSPTDNCLLTSLIGRRTGAFNRAAKVIRPKQCRELFA
jgi:hypothetical protein